MVYASSAAVYGDAATVPIVEAAERRPLSAYGADKLGCELHARVASHVHGDSRPSGCASSMCTGHGRTHAPRIPASSRSSASASAAARRSTSSATAGRRATSSMSPTWSRRWWRRCASRRRTRRCSMCAPASRPRCWIWRTPSPSSPARCSMRATGRRAPARSGTPPERPRCPRRILGLADPLSLRKGLGKVLDWMGGAV